MLEVPQSLLEWSGRAGDRVLIPKIRTWFECRGAIPAEVKVIVSLVSRHDRCIATVARVLHDEPVLRPSLMDGPVIEL